MITGVAILGLGILFGFGLSYMYQENDKLKEEIDKYEPLNRNEK